MVSSPTSQDYSLGLGFAGDRASFPLLRHIVNDLKPDGFALEFGVAEGSSLAIIAAHMPVFGFDSFVGLPAEWGPYPKGSRACTPPVIGNTRLVVGWYEDTLPAVYFAAFEPIGLVHIDCDLYSSTKTVLEHVGPHLRSGTICCFDEWHGNPWYADHEQRAWREYAEQTGVGWEVVGHDDEAWAIRLTGIGGVTV